LEWRSKEDAADDDAMKATGLDVDLCGEFMVFLQLPVPKYLLYCTPTGTVWQNLKNDTAHFAKLSHHKSKRNGYYCTSRTVTLWQTTMTFGAKSLSSK